MELISPTLKIEYREFCVDYLYLRQIDDFFESSDVKKGQPTRSYSGQRRTLVEEYYAGINWHNKSEVDKFLNVINLTLADRYLTDESRNSLIELCRKEGLFVEGHRVYWSRDSAQHANRKPLNTELIASLRDRLTSLESVEAIRRGFEFEGFLQQLFEAYDLAPRSPFRLIGEQIDGSFQLESQTYLVEAKWHSALTPQSDLLVFREKVESKSAWSRGLFISYSGFTDDGLQAFARGRATNIIGMTGQDLFHVLSSDITLGDVILKKARIAAETGDFYVSVFDLLRQQS